MPALATWHREPATVPWKGRGAVDHPSFGINAARLNDLGSWNRQFNLAGYKIEVSLNGGPWIPNPGVIIHVPRLMGAPKTFMTLPPLATSPLDPKEVACEFRMTHAHPEHPVMRAKMRGFAATETVDGERMEGLELYGSLEWKPEKGD